MTFMYSSNTGGGRRREREPEEVHDSHDRRKEKKV
jgi:hypothetical protein